MPCPVCGGSPCATCVPKDGARWSADGLRSWRGAFVLGEPSGWGELHSEGKLVRGNWVNGWVQGCAEIVYSVPHKAARYSGGVDVEMRPHGTGTIYIFESGDCYQGMFEHGLRSGQGVDRRRDWTYEGAWRNSVPHGLGRLTMSDGSEYRGDFHEGKRQGYGVYFAPGKGTYRGFFKACEYHGEGEMTWISGRRFVGSWRGGKRNGRGEYLDTDGTVVKGTWVADVLQGEAEVTHVNGVVWMVRYVDNEIVARIVEAPPPKAEAEAREDGERPCSVCLEAAVEVALRPCGHAVLCRECAKAVSTCPVCRAGVRGRLRVFF